MFISVFIYIFYRSFFVFPSAAGPYGLCIICNTPAPHFCLQTGDPLCGRECKARNLKLIEVLDANDGRSPQELTPAPQTSAADSSTKNELRRDALQVLQVLCRLSMQDAPSSPSVNTANPVDQRLVRCKRLSLELLLSMLQGSGKVFRSDEQFIRVIRSRLCISLIKNCVSHIPRIFGLSFSIFLYLTVHFKVGVLSLLRPIVPDLSLLCPNISSVHSGPSPH